VLATPPHAFVPDASPCLASSDRRLVFIGLDNILFGIDSYDCLDRVIDGAVMMMWELLLQSPATMTVYV
jgi:hypothetical protein